MRKRHHYSRFDDSPHEVLRHLSRERLAEVCQQWQVRELALFGSILRADFRPQSDVDLLIRFHEGSHWSMLDLMQLKEDLQDIFGRPVDLVEADAIRNPFRRRAILNSKQVIYEAP